METYESTRIKWPYATHLVDRRQVTGLLPIVAETNPGSLILARVQTIGRHKELETHDGRKMALFAGDVFVAVLGHRYATDQFEGFARCEGPTGHVFGIGGVSGQVIAMNNRMTEPTVIEWLGRLAGPDGEPLHMSQYTLPMPKARHRRPTTILSLGASMNAGKTTTAAQMIQSLTRAGHRVAAAKITGTACRKDPNLLYDAGAVEVLDFTHAGWPSTAGCSLDELKSVAAHLRAVLAARKPDFAVIEIADGIIQRETAMLLADDEFRSSIDAVTFAGPDALSCDSGVRRLQGLGYNVVATAGPVANSRLGQNEVEEACGVRCYDGASILTGALVPVLREVAEMGRAAQKAGQNGGGISSRAASILNAGRSVPRHDLSLAASSAVSNGLGGTWR